MKIVVKIGGAALEDKETLKKCAQAVVQLAEDGHLVTVVHGGGSALTRTLKLLGKTSDFVHGLRVTDAETRDVALMVLAGIVNKSLVAAIAAAGRPAIGLCGGDGGIFRARKKQDAEYDLGFVGEICFSEPRWLKAIWAEGGIPVLSSVALGGDGEYYNVNADQMAAACAIACEADALIFLTDVAGVKQADGSVMARLDTKQVAGLIDESIVSGGMMPKLEACTLALKSGVGRVRILPASQVEMLPLFYFTKLECGTEVLKA
jgi:acetylglutamate kinase